MPSLTSLRFCKFDHSDINILTGATRLFHAPNIENLIIQDMYSDALEEVFDFASSFEALAEMGFAMLYTLELAHFVSGSAEVLESFFCSLPKLRRLCVKYVKVDERSELFAERVFRAFLVPSERGTRGLPALPIPVACPFLEELLTLDISSIFLFRFARARAVLRLPSKRILYAGVTLSPKNVRKIQKLGVTVEEYVETEYEADD